MSLFALKSSHHANRTAKDNKTERAFHLLKFIGTDRDARAPSFNPPPIARRELVPPPKMTEEDRKHATGKIERKPGESAEAFETRANWRPKKKQDEWKWVVEGNLASSNNAGTRVRYEGGEDLTQNSSYVVLIPDQDQPGQYRVALLDHWVELRKRVDMSARKEMLDDERKRREMRAKMRENLENGQETVVDMELLKDKNFKAILEKHAADVGSKVTWVKGREEEEDMRNNKRYKRAGIVDEEDEYFRAKPGDRRNAEDKEDEDRDDMSIDHINDLAIDRMQQDPDDFGDAEHEFDDDDDGAAEDLTHNLAGFYEGEEEMAKAEDLIANMMEGEREDEAYSDEEDGGAGLARSQSPGYSDSDEEEKPAGGKAAATRVPMLAAAAPRTQVRAPAAAAALAAKPKTPLEETKSIVIEYLRAQGGRVLSEDSEKMSKYVHTLMGDKFNGATYKSAVGMVAERKKDDLDRTFFALKREFK